MDITTTEIDGRIIALTQQRNDALDEIVLLRGKLAVETERAARLAERVKDLEGAASRAD